MQHKSIKEMQDDILKLQARIDNPAVQEVHKTIYRATILKIRKMIEDVGVDTPNAPADEQTPIQSEPPDTQAQPRPIKASIPAEKPTAKQFVFTSPKAHSRRSAPPAAAPTIEVSASVSGGPKTVLIRWSDDRFVTLSEGKARSRFTSALRDLAASSHARRERFEDLRLYRTYTRAVGYYRALAALWGKKPTARQLDIKGMSHHKALIFNMISGNEEPT